MSDLKHFCKHCGSTKNERSFWEYIVNNDPELKHAKSYQKRTLVDMIIYYKQKNLNPLKPL